MDLPAFNLMITKVSVLKFLLLYTCLQKEELPISLTASVFPYWIIYNYIYIYIHTHIRTHAIMFLICMEEQNNWSTAKIPLLTLLYPFPSLPFVLFQQYSLKELSCLKILFFYSLLNLFQSSLCHFQGILLEKDKRKRGKGI